MTDTPSSSDVFVDGLIKRCQDDDRPYAFELLLDRTLRPYLATLDAAERLPSEDFAEALSGILATMLTTFIGRVIPSDDQDAAAELAQYFTDALAASLSADIAHAYTKKRTQKDIMVEALTKKGKLH